MEQLRSDPAEHTKRTKLAKSLAKAVLEREMGKMGSGKIAQGSDQGYFEVARMNKLGGLRPHATSHIPKQVF